MQVREFLSLAERAKSTGTPSLPLDAGCPHVWLGTCGSIHGLDGFLTGEDVGALSGMAHTPSKERRAFARGFLRAILCCHLGPTLAGGPLLKGLHGKPSLEGAPPGFSFNLSHSGDHVAVAFLQERELSPASERPWTVSVGLGVGVDVEAADCNAARARRLGPRVLDHQALARLEASPDTDAPSYFLRQWVAREALLKATGEGLSRDPRSVVLPLPPAFDEPRVCDLGSPWGLLDVFLVQESPPVAVAYPNTGGIGAGGSRLVAVGP